VPCQIVDFLKENITFLGVFREIVCFCLPWKKDAVLKLSDFTANVTPTTMVAMTQV